MVHIVLLVLLLSGCTVANHGAEPYAIPAAAPPAPADEPGFLDRLTRI